MSRIRKLFSVLMFVLLFLLFSVPTAASNEECDGYWQDFLENVPEDALQGGEEELSGIGIDTLLGELFSALGGGFGEAVPLLLLLFGTAVLMTASEAASPFECKAFSAQISAGVVSVCSLFIFGKLMPLIISAKESLEELSVFFSGLVPVMSGILLAGGNAASSASQAMNMNITLAVVSLALSKLLLPICFTLFSLALVGSFDGGHISSIARSVKSLFMWILGIGTAVIIAAVSMQSVISGAQDSAYLRAAKYAASGMIPIVGSTVSSALSTLAGGLSYVKSTVGVSAVFVVAVMSLAPLIKLLLSRFAFSVSISFLEFVGAQTGAKVFSAFRAALDALIALYAAVSVVYIAELVVFLKSGVDVFG